MEFDAVLLLPFVHSLMFSKAQIYQGFEALPLARNQNSWFVSCTCFCFPSVFIFIFT